MTIVSSCVVCLSRRHLWTVEERRAHVLELVDPTPLATKEPVAVGPALVPRLACPADLPHEFDLLQLLKARFWFVCECETHVCIYLHA